MKKLITSIVTLLIMFSILYVALASPCPLPPSNTDAEINFSGFEWYTDYPTTLKAAKERGLSDTWFNDFFYDDYCTTPHWQIVYTSLSSFAGSETRCGGSVNYYTDIPNVAGYRVDGLELYFMWNEETGYTTEYKKPGAAQFYMAKYEFDVKDYLSCYDDLVEKLKSIYGNNPYSDTYGLIDPSPYTLWINQDGALVGVGHNSYATYLVYMAPGAEDKLVAIEEKVKAQEIENASDDISGL